MTGPNRKLAHCSSSTKPAFCRERLEGQLTAPLDELRQRGKEPTPELPRYRKEANGAAAPALWVRCST
jgi:hypothetical protein